MNNIKKSFIYKVGCVFGLSATFLSCSDDVLEVRNENVPPIELFSTNEVLLKGAVNAIYKPMQSQGSYGRWQYFLEDITSDEVFTSVGQPPIDRIAAYRLDNDTEANTLYWESCFAGIRAANNFLAGIPEVTDANKAFVAEARFLRGHYVFLLTSRFSGIPLNDETVLEVVPSPRTSYAESMQFAIDDFTFASENLPAVGEQERGRPTSSSAFAYLGKALLFSIEPTDFGSKPEVYDQAFNAFDNVTGYSLVDNYDDNFNYAGEYNNESIFEIDFSRLDVGQTQFWSSNLPDGRTDITMRSVEYSSWGNGTPRPTFLAEYETKEVDGEEVDDPRKAATFWSPGAPYASGSKVWGEDADEMNNAFGAPASGTSCTRKFSEYIENAGSFTGSGINFRIIRLADVLLMKAEAALFKSSPDMGLALTLMNQVRRRPSVDMPDYPTEEFPCSNIDETFEALVHERKIELAMEGKRTLDIGRWGIDEQVLSPIINGYNSNKRFLPIPNTELLTNPVFGADNPQ